MRKQFVLLLVVAAGLSSCSKFLEAKSQSEMTPKTTIDYSQLLFGSGYPRFDERFMPAVRLMSDDLQVYSNLKTSAEGTLQGIPAFSWQPSLYLDLQTAGFDPNSEEQYYKPFYSHIINCNIAIQNADGSQGMQSDKNYLAGEAYALRAYYYFTLVNLFGKPFNDSATTPDKSPGVPLVTSPNLSEDHLPRNSVAEVYQQIVRDLDSANARLKIEKRVSSNYRLNHLSAQLLASRVHLYMEQWDKTIAAADYVLQISPALFDLNSWGADWYYGLEPYKPISTGKNIETLWLYGSGDDFGINMPTSLRYDVSEDLAAQFEFTDLRSIIYYGEVPDFLREIFPSKYMTQKLSYGTSDIAPGGSFRTSEVYLNRAEAYAQKYSITGDVNFAQKALADLNTLRSKRYSTADFQPVGLMPAAELLQFCRNERRRELFDENHRWFDLRRYGMPEIAHYYSPSTGINTKYVLNARDPQYVLPFPEPALLRNVKLEQNPKGPKRNPVN